MMVPIESVEYGFIKKNFELHSTQGWQIKPWQNCFSLTSARDLVRDLVGDSHQVRTVITVERLMVFRFTAHIALQVAMIQVVAAFKERWSGDLLPETL